MIFNGLFLGAYFPLLSSESTGQQVWPWEHLQKDAGLPLKSLSAYDMWQNNELVSDFTASAGSFIFVTIIT